VHYRLFICSSSTKIGSGPFVLLSSITQMPYGVSLSGGGAGLLTKYPHYCVFVRFSLLVVGSGLGGRKGVGYSGNVNSG
jgi:hypothetical protein